MSPLLVVLTLACVLLVLATGALAAALVTVRRRADAALEAGRAANSADVAALREQIAELTARQSELEHTRDADPADYVITFDQTEPIQVSTGRVVSATLGEPLIKVAALGHGVRRALREEKRAHLTYQVRREYRRRRKATRSSARAAARRAR